MFKRTRNIFVLSVRYIHAFMKNFHLHLHAEESNQPIVCNRLTFAVRKTVCVLERVECNNEVQLLWKSSFQIDLECNDMESSSVPR